MFSSSEKYYETIRNLTYVKFDKTQQKHKEYKDISVGFFAACSYHPSAWNECLKSVRIHFPTQPIVIFQDGFDCKFNYSNMASEYNATYLVQEHGVYTYWPKPQQCWTFLNMLLKACEVCNTDWLIYLHPDNICNDRIHIIPPGPVCGVGAGSRNGISNNSIKNLETYIKSIYPNLEYNGYGWCGGGCINTEIFKQIMKTFTYEKLISLYYLFNFEEGKPFPSNYDDLFIPFLFNIHGFPYRIWLEIEEPHRGEYGYGSSAAFQHGEKKFYDNKNITNSDLWNKMYLEIIKR